MQIFGFAICRTLLISNLQTGTSKKFEDLLLDNRYGKVSFFKICKSANSWAHSAVINNPQILRCANLQIENPQMLMQNPQTKFSKFLQNSFKSWLFIKIFYFVQIWIRAVYMQYLSGEKVFIYRLAEVLSPKKVCIHKSQIYKLNYTSANHKKDWVRKSQIRKSANCHICWKSANLRPQIYVVEGSQGCLKFTVFRLICDYGFRSKICRSVNPKNAACSLLHNLFKISQPFQYFTR